VISKTSSSSLSSPESTASASKVVLEAMIGRPPASLLMMGSGEEYFRHAPPPGMCLFRCLQPNNELNL
jgi:hypothetical protein